MGLFDKKICDICGEKIGLLGNRKLDDGNLCKDCAKKIVTMVWRPAAQYGRGYSWWAECRKDYQGKYPYTKVLVVTSLIDPKLLERAKSGCADSLWYKDHGEEEIRSVIYRTLNGEHVFPDVAPEVELNWITSGDISPRQLEMLRLYIHGMSYSEIARKMDCSAAFS